MPSIDLTILIELGQFAGLREFPGYGASSDGRAWSCWKNRGGGRYILTDDWKPLKPGRGAGGHLFVNLRRDGRAWPRYIHRLVLETFVGPCPDGMECCHDDDDPANNFLDNLRWDTRLNNKADSIRNGGHVAPPRNLGSRSGNAKLDEEDIPRIRELRRQGLGPKRISQRFGVSEGTIDRILRGASWKHV